jgi:hypothetical protein
MQILKNSRIPIKRNIKTLKKNKKSGKVFSDTKIISKRPINLKSESTN